MRPSIALAMIVKNEEHNLPRVIGSVKDCVDAVYVTDTGSTDNTVDVAKSLGARVSHFTWIQDFAAARNASFEPVKEDYIMWLDADDVLDNPRQFKLWRDDVMALSDYWIVPYHYTLGPDGKPLCTFARERVVRREMGFKWRYVVHEGMPPIPTGLQRQPKLNIIQHWAVKHMRTQADLERDKGRNMAIFEVHKAKLDTRMNYYWGKELFEQKQPVEAIQKLMEAVSKPDLELHDRQLAIQYAATAYLQCNQPEKAIDTALMGVQLAPQRAEYWNIIGDSHIKIGSPQNAVPFYNAAMNCAREGGNGVPSPLFTQANLYDRWPRNQLARIYGQAGMWDKAANYAKESADLGDEDGKKLYDEICRLRDAVTSFASGEPKECGDIVITSPPQTAYEWDADIAKTRNMGGSEWAAIQIALHLRRLSGRRTIIFNMRTAAKVCDGVEYRPVGEVYDYFRENKPYLHIAWRHNNKLTNAPTFLWCHDLQTPGGEAHDRYTRILALTPFHKRYLMAVQGIPEEKILVTRNGLVPERFAGGPWEKDPNRVVFTSSPDRGLDRAIRLVGMVRDEFPDIKLHVYYGIEHLEKWGHGDLQRRLEVMIKESPWVVYHGATQQDKLTEDLKKSNIWLHPCDFVETSAITAMEMVCAGVYPVTRRLGGLQDTLAGAEKLGMAKLLDHDCIKESEYAAYENALRVAMRGHPEVKIDANKLAWEGVAKEWLETLPRLAHSQQ